MWYHSYFSELGYETPNLIPLHGDNKGSVDLSQNPVTGRKSKHIPIKHHAIREYVENGIIDLIRTPSLDMLADGMTKSLAHADHSKLVTGLGLSNQAMS